jgi:hypothetical protein
MKSLFIPKWLYIKLSKMLLNGNFHRLLHQ